MNVDDLIGGIELSKIILCEEKKVSINDIKTYTTKRKNCGDYSLGGYYLIYDTKNDKGYIGRSLNVLERLRSHYYLSTANKGLLIDRELNNRIDDFNFYVLGKYTDLNIDFYTRKLGGVIEYKFIEKFKTYYPYGYNIAHYERI